MSHAVQILLNIELEYARHIIARTDATGLIKYLREFGVLRLTETEFHQLSAICDKIDIRREDRNLIIHGLWGRAPGSGIPSAMSLRIKPDEPDRIVSETFPRNRMLEIISDIQSLKLALMSLLKLGEQPSKPSEQPPEE